MRVAGQMLGRTKEPACVSAPADEHRIAWPRHDLCIVARAGNANGVRRGPRAPEVLRCNLQRSPGGRAAAARTRKAASSARVHNQDRRLFFGLRLGQVYGRGIARITCV